MLPIWEKHGVKFEIVQFAMTLTGDTQPCLRQCNYFDSISVKNIWHITLNQKKVEFDMKGFVYFFILLWWIFLPIKSKNIRISLVNFSFGY